MDTPTPFILAPNVEAAGKALALQAAAKFGYTLNEEQTRALAYELFYEQPGSPAAVGHIVAEFCKQLVYDLENEHPIHTWARWARDVENDQTPPCQNYTDYVDERHHLATVLVDGQHYTADRGTREGLDAYFSKKTDRLKPHLTSEQFGRFVQDRIQEGRMQPIVAAAAVG